MTQSIATLLDQPKNASLNYIVKRARVLLQLNALFISCLPEDLAAHCRLVNVKEESCLIVAADTGTWATRLQMKAGDLLDTLHKHPEFSGISTIRCRVLDDLR